MSEQIHVSGKELLDDRSLALLAQQGDRSSFEILVKRHQKKILNACYRIIGYSEDAKEVAADAFAEAFRSLKNFKSDAQFGTWVYRIALNLSFQNLRVKARNRKRIVSSDDQNADHSLELEPDPKAAVAREALEWEETLGTIRLVLSKISKAHAEMLVLCDIEGLSYVEVGKLLNCPNGTVMSRLSRARDSFRNEWNKHAKD